MILNSDDKVVGLLWGGDDNGNGYATDIFGVTTTFGLVMG